MQISLIVDHTCIQLQEIAAAVLIFDLPLIIPIKQQYLTSCNLHTKYQQLTMTTTHITTFTIHYESSDIHNNLHIRFEIENKFHTVSYQQESTDGRQEGSTTIFIKPEVTVLPPNSSMGNEEVHNHNTIPTTTTIN